jgi:hypothetical protein
MNKKWCWVTFIYKYKGYRYEAKDDFKGKSQDIPAVIDGNGYFAYFGEYVRQ